MLDHLSMQAICFCISNCFISRRPSFFLSPTLLSLLFLLFLFPTALHLCWLFPSSSPLFIPVADICLDSISNLTFSPRLLGFHLSIIAGALTFHYLIGCIDFLAIIENLYSLYPSFSYTLLTFLLFYLSLCFPEAGEPLRNWRLNLQDALRSGSATYFLSYCVGTRLTWLAPLKVGREGVNRTRSCFFTVDIRVKFHLWLPPNYCVGFI